MLFELIKNSSNGIDIIHFINIDQDIIQVDDHTNIQLLSQNLIDVLLKAYWQIRKAKQHHLILKMTIFDAKNRLLLIFFINLYHVVSISQIKLGKLLSLTQLIQGFTNQKQQVLILYDQIIKILIIDIQVKTAIRLLNKENWITYKAFERSYKTVGSIDFDICFQVLTLFLLIASS